jgi:uncharacterized hydrophobic protein (TIGR00341 family)
MAQNLLQIVLPPGFDTQIQDLVEEGTHLGSWETLNDDAQSIHHILLDSAEVQEVVDRLENRFAASTGFSVLLLPIDASLPRPRKEEKPEEPELALTPTLKKKSYHAKISRETLYGTVSEGVEPDRVYFAMVLLSSLVAAFGLIRDDIPVLVGAMVIAPLLMPNVALALATTLGDIDLWRRALKSNLMGIALAFAISVAIGLFLESDLGGEEIVKRTAPQLPDLALATISGIAGALALTAGLSGAVIGVMVAVALMPPLVTLGLLVGMARWSDASGAFLLLAANIICVNLAGVATFLFMGVEPRTWWESKKAERATRLAMTVWVVLFLILAGILLL